MAMSHVTTLCLCPSHRVSKNLETESEKICSSSSREFASALTVSPKTAFQTGCEVKIMTQHAHDARIKDIRTDSVVRLQTTVSAISG